MKIAILIAALTQTFCALGSEDELRNLVDIYDDNFNIFMKYSQKYVKLSNNDVFAILKPSEWQVPETIREYDFIVVGSGSAGSVIANRLTENPNWNVLLLEAGKGENLFVQIPLIAPVFQFTHYDWQYLMEYQPGFAMGMDQNLLAWPRGRALGGSSVINYMIYTRGNPRDFDRWAAQGNPGWSYEEILPYYLKSEDAKLSAGNPLYHSTGGYMSIEDVYRSPTARAFVKGGNELGYNTVDYTSPDMIGFSTVQATVKQGRRDSVAKAFLQPVRDRKNLHILTSAYVTKLLINPATKQAYGVQYVRNGKSYTVYTKKEVILSAGTFNSPQLLMLAGIGPKEHLEKLGIPVLRDAPVGQNLHDHITHVGLAFRLNESVSLSAARVLADLPTWLLNGKGSVSSLGGVEGISYIKTPLSQEEGDFPDIELIFVDGALNSDYGIVSRKTMRIRDDIYNTVFKPLENTPTWTIFPMLLHPKSIGQMRLRSRDPHDYPLFYGNYLTDPEEQDINTLVAAIRFIIKLSQTPAFQRYQSTLHNIPLPECEFYVFNSNQYWKCAIRTLSITLHHQVGTCKMGPSTDPTSVVDSELKVHGISNLRVADCSVIPFALSAHTNAPAIMVGEKASDLIKSTWAGH